MIEFTDVQTYNGQIAAWKMVTNGNDGLFTY
jgi:hypothetical protein